MSFDFDMGQVMQYAFNIFSSVSPVMYMYAGAALGLFIIGGIIAVVRSSKDK